jgi:hypothetical protein
MISTTLAVELPSTFSYIVGVVCEGPLRAVPALRLSLRCIL